jgi:HK97 gp10 family phage protein
VPGAISRIEGMGPSLANLRRLSEYAEKQIGNNALKAGAAVAVKRVKAKAKVSSRANDPTRGSLKESVRDKPGRAKKGVDTRAVIVEDVAAVAKEFGLSRRNYPAEPFARPAIDSAREEIGQAIADSVKNDVENGPWR